MSIFDNFNSGGFGGLAAGLGKKKRRPQTTTDWQSFVDGLSRPERDQLYPGMHKDLIPAYEMITGGDATWGAEKQQNGLGGKSVEPQHQSRYLKRKEYDNGMGGTITAPARPNVKWIELNAFDRPVRISGEASILQVGDAPVSSISLKWHYIDEDGTTVEDGTIAGFNSHGFEFEAGIHPEAGDTSGRTGMHEPKIAILLNGRFGTNVQVRWSAEFLNVIDYMDEIDD